MHKDTTLQCVLNSLSLFGDNAKASLVARLSKERISFTPEDFDIQKFCKVAEELFDGAANLLFAKIIDDLCRQPGASLEDLGLAGRSKYMPYGQLLREIIAKIEV
jgi:hypothetical protein